MLRRVLDPNPAPVGSGVFTWIRIFTILWIRIRFEHSDPDRRQKRVQNVLQNLLEENIVTI